MPTSRLLLLALAGLLAGALPVAAAPASRAFTYQGRLAQGGVPVNGPVTLRFSLWNMEGTGDPPVGGVVLGGPQVVPGVAVSDGLFTVRLNAADEFGPVAFNGEERWLQVEVCDDSTCTSATVLGPRQAMTATPYAAHALGPWQLSGTSVTYAAGDVGIGTSTPAARLHIQDNVPSLIIQDTATAANQAGYIGFWNNASAETGWIGFGSPGSPHLSIYNGRSSGRLQLFAGAIERMSITSGGSVGLGTTAPAERLDVRGNIKLGPSGQYFAPSAAANLRIVRGKISSAGAIISGEGFTVSRTGEGVYSISWSPSFAAAPVVTATADYSSSWTRIATVVGPTTLSTTIRIVNSDNTSVDNNFYFIAIGTR
jgi:hypothetical protein